MENKKIKNFLKSEFINGQTTFDWCFMLFGIALQIFAVWYGYHTGTPDSIVSIISGITGIISVVLCAEGKISFYLFGYIQLFTYVIGIAIPFALWGEVVENVYYFITMIIGTVIWFKNYKTDDNGATAVKSKKLDYKGWITWVAIFIVSTIALGFILMHIHEIIPTLEADPQPWLDSITTTAPFIAQVLLMLGYREQWAFWIVEDIISLVMFTILGSWVMVAQYLFWTINCVYGWIKWTKQIESGEN